MSHDVHACFHGAHMLRMPHFGAVVRHAECHCAILETCFVQTLWHVEETFPHMALIETLAIASFQGRVAAISGSLFCIMTIMSTARSVERQNIV